MRERHEHKPFVAGTSDWRRTAGKERKAKNGRRRSAGSDPQARNLRILAPFVRTCPLRRPACVWGSRLRTVGSKPQNLASFVHTCGVGGFVRACVRALFVHTCLWPPFAHPRIPPPQESTLREISPTDGTVIRKVEIEDKYFAEGITLTPSYDIKMLTWREKTGMTFARDTFKKLDSWDYTTHNGEGWGITMLGAPGAEEFVVSDGSEFLFVWDVNDGMEEKRRIKVTTSDGKSVKYLNELEAYKGDILANVWYSDVILRIDINTGMVKVIYDFADLWPHGERPKHVDCFNGIALLEDDKLLVTGKLWPSYFVVKLEGE